MKFSNNWLRELVDGLDLAPAELMRLITMKSAECEGVAEHAPWLARVVAARVESVTPIEGSHNVEAVVDAGPKFGKRTVVCGAPNCKPGMVTAYVPSGTKLEKLEIRKATIGGVESDGMLASGEELGVSRDHTGIVVVEAKPGESIPGLTPDHAIEVDNKSLTHRPDLWGHHGLAREVAAFTGKKLREPADPDLLPKEANAEWEAVIEDHDLAPRYSALVFENVTVGPSPLWLQARLQAIDLNPINNIVDVTNYIMAEMAQPMHAFDADRLVGKTIYVRPAKPGEICQALNGEFYALSSSNLVIADEGGAVAIAGVIGGNESAITEKTTRIVLESANFNAACIRKTSSALRLRTDASMRFEKAQDPVNTVRALARAVELLKLVSPGVRLSGGLVDNYRPLEPPRPIKLPHEWLEKKLGRRIEPAKVQAILEGLQFAVTQKDETYLVTVPSWRATKDITIKDDLVEEIGRMIGYDSIPPQAPMQPAKRPWVNEERHFHHDLRQMVAAQGFTETYSYSFISEEMARLFGLEPDAHLRVKNPISSEQSLMRMSLLPGMHRNIVENMKRFETFRLFEIGKEIHKQAGGLPNEVPHLLAALYSKDDGKAALYELKRLAGCLMPGCEVRPAPAKGYEHPARSAFVACCGEILGRLFELHPSLVETGRAAVLDLDVGTLFAMGKPAVKYKPLTRYPSSAFDLSVVTGVRTLVADVGQVLSSAVKADSVEYLYTYRGQPLPDDRQSVTFRVTVSAEDHTLSNEEVTALRNTLIEALHKAGFGLRG